MPGKGKIIVLKGEGFDRMPEAWRDAAVKYALGRTFNSLYDIINQGGPGTVNPMGGFRVAEYRGVPRDLPEVITEADIIAHWGDSHNNTFDCVALKAKYLG